MALNRDQILNAKDLKVREVHVPEWVNGEGDDVVLVRGLSGDERDAYQTSLTKRYKDPRTGSVDILPDLVNANARLVVKVVVDGEGNRLFRDEEAPSLGQKSAAALQRVFEVAAEMSGMTEAAVEDAEKNSETTPSGDSSSSGQKPPDSQ